MSYLDIGLCLMTVMVILLLFVRAKPLNELTAILVLAIMMIVLHMVMDKVRWQVLPMYGLPLIAVVHNLLSHIDVMKIRQWLLRINAGVFSLLLVLSIGATMAMPIPELEAPNGTYNVGTSLVNIQDYERNEIYGPQTGPRDLRLQIWYPSDETRDTQEPWFIDGEKSLQDIAKSYNMFWFMLDHLQDVKASSYRDVAVSSREAKYPVIIMSHGWASSRTLHNHYGEHLASHGYIVVGLDHMYASVGSRLSDGTPAEHDSDILPEEDFIEAGRTLIEVFSQDIGFVLDQLNDFNEDHFILKTKMNLDKIGLLGHSTGAGADVLYGMNHQVQAFVGLDPWVAPLDALNPLKIPSLYVRSEEWHDHENNENLFKLTDQVVEIQGTTHYDFTMALKFSPFLEYVGRSGGDTSGLQLNLIQNHFDHYLKNQVVEPLDDPRVRLLSK